MKKQDDEQVLFEELLRRRGVSAKGNPVVEREILEKFQSEVAVLILDSSGFTRLTQKHGIIHFLALFVAMRDLVARLFDPHHAIGWWAEADNMFAMFPTARFALECAVAIQDKVWEANEARPADDRLDVCIGIGFGKMLKVGRGNAFGDEMNLASKLGEDIAEAGEILLTERAHEEVREAAKALDAAPVTVRISGVEIPYFRIRRPIAR